VEGETLACGTGVTATALISARLHGFKSPVKVRVQGGEELEVSFKDEGGEFSDVRLKGPAEFCVRGTDGDLRCSDLCHCAGAFRRKRPTRVGLPRRGSRCF